MTLFGTSRLGRIGYAIVLMLVFCFDRVRGPIQQYGMDLLNKATKELWARVPARPDMQTIDKPHGLSTELQDLSDYIAILQTALPIATLIMTAVTIITLLWMVSSRLRDIGLPQYGLLVVLSPILLPRIIVFADLEIQGIAIAFYAMLVILAFIPGKDTKSLFMAQRPIATPVVVKRQPGQFGRRGTH